MTASLLDQRAIAALRLLSADMVQAANSGHPGMPLGCAPMAWTLWSRHLRHDPTDPDWADRDRFILSAGHGSALQYSLLHLFGYGLSTQDLRQFRQIGSLTPGHPEAGHTPGVETTTGPLGQGLAAAVGMALAERMLNARQGDRVNHRTFVIAGDGCLMEGLSHEAASLAGHLGLGRLIVLYDDNQITIDGSTALSCTDDPLTRFASYGWHTSSVADGTDIDAIDAAVTRALADDRPSLIAVSTRIGEGAPDVAGTSGVHGSPLGAERIQRMRAQAAAFLGDWPEYPFEVPEDVLVHCQSLAAQGTAQHQEWSAAFGPEPAAAPDRPDLQTALAAVDVAAPMATREASARVLAALSAAVPELVGGSADLAGSTGTSGFSAALVQAKDYAGGTIAFGIREHAMASVLNGIAGHGGLRPFGSTFLVFSDYLRPALRLSALMGLPVIYLFTHDSVAVGEDGPTHQPIEQVESLRLIPGLAVLRPCDAAETVEAWRTALERTDGPTALILSRQALPPQTVPEPGFVAQTGARVVLAAQHPQVTILATGSEVSLACTAGSELTQQGVPTQVVSVPWRERFAELSPQARAGLTGNAPVVVSVEAGRTTGWASVLGSSATASLGIDTFGLSGPGDQVLRELGLNVTALHRTIHDLRQEAGNA